VHCQDYRAHELPVRPTRNGQLMLPINVGDSLLTVDLKANTYFVYVNPLRRPSAPWFHQVPVLIHDPFLLFRISPSISFRRLIA